MFARSSGSLRLRGAAFVVRPAILEEHDRSDHHGRPASRSNATSGSTGDGNQTSPVRIAAVNRGFHEQRVGDGFRGLPRLGRRRCSVTR